MAPWDDVPATRIAIALTALAALIVAVTLVLRGGDEPPPPAVLAPGAGVPAQDPLAWTPERSDEYARRAADGWSHALYTRTADGLATEIGRAHV